MRRLLQGQVAPQLLVIRRHSRGRVGHAALLDALILLVGAVDGALVAEVVARGAVEGGGGVGRLGAQAGPRALGVAGVDPVGPDCVSVGVCRATLLALVVRSVGWVGRRAGVSVGGFVQFGVDGCELFQLGSTAVVRRTGTRLAAGVERGLCGAGKGPVKAGDGQGSLAVGSVEGGGDKLRLEDAGIDIVVGMGGKDQGRSRLGEVSVRELIERERSAR